MYLNILIFFNILLYNVRVLISVFCTFILQHLKIIKTSDSRKPFNVSYLKALLSEGFTVSVWL